LYFCKNRPRRHPGGEVHAPCENGHETGPITGVLIDVTRCGTLLVVCEHLLGPKAAVDAGAEILALRAGEDECSVEKLRHIEVAVRSIFTEFDL